MSRNISPSLTQLLMNHGRTLSRAPNIPLCHCRLQVGMLGGFAHGEFQFRAHKWPSCGLICNLTCKSIQYWIWGRLIPVITALTFNQFLPYCAFLLSPLNGIHHCMHVVEQSSRTQSLSLQSVLAPRSSTSVRCESNGCLRLENWQWWQNFRMIDEYSEPFCWNT